MLFAGNKIADILIGGLICFTPIGRSPSAALYYRNNESLKSFSPAGISDPDGKKGYRDIVKYEDRFLAVGTDGRIDYISKSGKITRVVNDSDFNLNSVICDGKAVITVGDNGTILLSSDGQNYKKIDAGTKKNINGITSLNGMLIAAADKGIILISENGYTWSSINLNVKGDIVSVAANNSKCFGVTNRGEIIKSTDGINWEITDYNSQYAGYNKPCIFKNVILTVNRIVLIGQHDDGTPVALFSSIGNVWTERLMSYNDDQGIPKAMINHPNDIAYDKAGDQFFLACDNGEIVSLPSCSKCNKSLTATKNDLYGIICTDNSLLCVGEDYFVNIISLR